MDNQNATCIDLCKIYTLACCQNRSASTPGCHRVASLDAKYRHKRYFHGSTTAHPQLPRTLLPLPCVHQRRFHPDIEHLLKGPSKAIFDDHPSDLFYPTYNPTSTPPIRQHYSSIIYSSQPSIPNKNQNPRIMKLITLTLSALSALAAAQSNYDVQSAGFRLIIRSNSTLNG